MSDLGSYPLREQTLLMPSAGEYVLRWWFFFFFWEPYIGQAAGSKKDVMNLIGRAEQ
jgi:hypothetical protein